jgi:cytochrome c oxidase assembly factor CtaG/putative copper export protein
VVNSRALRAVGPLVLGAAALVGLLIFLAYGGGAAPLVIADPGPVVRWGLPVSTLAVNLGAAGMAGSLVLALFALKAGERPFEIALDTASISAAVFTVAAGVTGFFTFVNVSNAAPSGDMLFGEQLGSFLVQQELGRTWLFTTVGGAAITVLTFAVRGWTSTLLVAILSLVVIVPMGTQGHSGELSTHDVAMTSLIEHMLAAAIWVGGLLLVVVVRPLLSKRQLPDLLRRYSSIALFAFVVVAYSGTARAIVAIGDWPGLFTPYGGILVVKIVLLIALGALGAWYRLRLIGRMEEDRRARRFWGLVVLELVLMGLASGAGVALARTPPPVSDAAPTLRTPAEILSGSPLPPEPHLSTWLTSWNFDPVWVVLIAAAAFFYLAGVWRLRRRGDRWPVYRTILWMCGLAALLWVTCGPINVYQEYLFSVHMTGHMLLTMALPMLLVPGAPITLALRTIRKRDDGTRGGREWIMWALHSPFGRIITNPFVTAALFVGSLFVFYYTDLFRWSVYDHAGHEWMTAHFLITGYLFVLSLIGIDPVPYRLPYPGRLVTLLAVIAIHAFFGVAIMEQTSLMVAEWFGSMGRTWGPTPLEDQYTAGGVAWSIGEIPSLILALTVAIQWSRNDDRRTRNRDRHADRTGDTELQEYNARLQELAERDARAGSR